MAKIKVAINGFGRIGRNVFKLALERDNIEIVGINDLTDTKTLAHLLKYDSTQGKFNGTVTHDDTSIIVNGKSIKISAEKNPANIPWPETPDVVVEGTGVFRTKEGARGGYGDHLKNGARKVILTVPAKDEIDNTIVLGVNDEMLRAEDQCISNASCTTNCLAPLTKAVDDAFKVITGLMCTTHAATSTQRVQDFFGGGKNRATLNNIIPASTGAAIAVGKVLPHLNGKLNGTALRVPTDTGSVTEVTYLIEGKHSVDEINAKVAENAAKINGSSLSGRILDVDDYYECSRDCVGEPWSSMYIPGNSRITEAGDNTLVKMTSFYDNEMGYSSRMAELSLIFAAL
jgi:glyceraldehyde 3-phosphate dehydrogenase